MNYARILLAGLGIIAGGLIAIQSVLNASLGQRIGNLGSVFVLTLISALTLIILIIIFPASSNLSSLPGRSEWYLYVGGVLGVAILAVPIFLVPRIGTTSTLIAIVLGQLTVALVIDQFGLFASPKIGISFVRILGIMLVAIGTYLVGR
jgi:transporter family-2 protein